MADAKIEIDRILIYWDCKYVIIINRNGSESIHMTEGAYNFTFKLFIATPCN